jgi:uncharacterized protein (DUF1697 family)
MRYVAFLRGVSPANASMPALQRCFEQAGFENVRTLLSSGNVVFDARKASHAALEKRAEAAMRDGLGHAFDTVVRSCAELQALLEADAFARHALPADAKRVVSFLRDPQSASAPVLPVEKEGARILERIGGEVYTFYTPTPKGPVFMQLLERHFGKDITTRTWDTVRKCAGA